MAETDNQMMMPKRDWRIQEYRYTIFPSSPILPVDDLDQWWTALIGSNPVEFNRRPAEAYSVVVGSAKFGEVDSKVIIEQLIDRFHLRIQTAPLPPDPDFPWPVIGQLKDTVTIFNDLVGRCCNLPLWPNQISRVALGSTLLLPVISREEGYSVLSDLLHYVEIDPVGSENFAYQINRPKSTKFGNVNRLMHWMTTTMSGPIALKIEGTQVDVQPTIEQKFAVKLAIDISTKIENADTIKAASQIEVYSVLLNLAMEIADRGDFEW